MAMDPKNDPDALLTPSEVAAMFRVNPKTVTRWARAGKISAIRTLGGHRRFRPRRSAGSSSRSKRAPRPPERDEKGARRGFVGASAQRDDPGNDARVVSRLR